MDVRSEAIEAVISIVHTELSRYEAVASPDSTRRHLCQVQVSWDLREACDTMIHGSLIRSLIREGYYQKSMDELVKMPNHKLYHLSENVEEFDILYLKPIIEDTGLHGDHSACVTVDFRKEVHKTMRNLRSPVLDSHIEHMRSQRDKLGRTKPENAAKKRKRSVACCR